MSNRAMVKLIHADGFFDPDTCQRYVDIVSNLNFVEKPYGKEIENFNMIFPKIEPLLGRVLGERIVLDHKRSGVFRRPIDNVIHFEDFSSLNEWCFIVALEKTTLNLWHHLEDYHTKFDVVNAKTALDGWQFNYRNLFEWTIHTNVLMEPSDGVFIRPWVFHSLNNGIVQYYRLISDKKFRVLVIGLPGTGRKEFSRKLNEALPSSDLLQSYAIREDQKDIDFTHEGRMRHTYRMLEWARRASKDVAVMDMVCPYAEMRDLIVPDILVWYDEKTDCSEDIKKDFENPEIYDIRVNKSNESEMIEQIVQRVKAKLQ